MKEPGRLKCAITWYQWGGLPVLILMDQIYESRRAMGRERDCSLYYLACLNVIC
jgi:hypothetical protein